MIRIIPWILSFIAMVGAVFNVYKDITGFYIWICSNTGWAIYILFYKQKNLYGQIPLWLTFTALNIWGVFCWR